MKLIGSFELIVMLALLNRENMANGESVQDELLNRAGIRAARGAVYITLSRLESKGLLESAKVITGSRAGRRTRRLYSVTDSGSEAIRIYFKATDSMRSGLITKFAGPTI